MVGKPGEDGRQVSIVTLFPGSLGEFGPTTQQDRNPKSGARLVLMLLLTNSPLHGFSGQKLLTDGFLTTP